MKYFTYAALLMLLAASPALGTDTALHARADIMDSGGENVGKAVFTETADGVRIVLEVHDLPPGLHGIHIHEAGECKIPDFKSAGGHFNPAGKQHGAKNPQGAHAGDLPNLQIQPDGTAKAVLINPHVTLAPGNSSLFHDAGTSLVIHAGPDDELTDPSGNSGDRIACGVITR